MDDSPQPDFYATTTDLAASQPAATAPSPSTSSIATPLLISFAGVMLTLLVLLAYHFLIVNFCLRRRGTGCGKNGVDERVLKAIPILTYSKEDKSTKNGVVAASSSDDCVICIVELEEGATVRFLPSCGHVFHARCVDHWFSAHSSCPTCRAPVVLPPTLSARDNVMKSRGARNAAVGEGQARDFALALKRSLSMDDLGMV